MILRLQCPYRFNLNSAAFVMQLNYKSRRMKVDNTYHMHLNLLFILKDLFRLNTFISVFVIIETDTSSVIYEKNLEWIIFFFSFNLNLCSNFVTYINYITLRFVGSHFKYIENLIFNSREVLWYVIHKFHFCGNIRNC